MYCQHCGKQIKDDATYCEHCGSAVGYTKPQVKQESVKHTEQVSAWLIILSLIIPIAGIIVGAVRYNEHPDTSKIYIWCGIGSIIFGLVLMLLGAGDSTYYYY